jgi:hypothetical protein
MAKSPRRWHAAWGERQRSPSDPKAPLASRCSELAICGECRPKADAVASEHCDACGFDGARYDNGSLLDALRGQGGYWRALLVTSGSNLRVRPQPEVWSAIEYAAHTRDVIALHVYGVEQALNGDEPVFPPISDDLVESAAATYGDSDSDEVVAELASHAARLAEVAQDAGDDMWGRGLTIGDARSDVRRLLEHALHDSIHHLGDVERGLALLPKQDLGGRR